MGGYDSDSSGGEDNDFTETNVLLGYASGDANGEEISRLGGRPDWLDISKPPSSALARCKVCKSMLVLLLQLNGELPDRFPGHERRIYIFACRNKTCRRKDGSIRAIRGVRVSPDAPAPKETKPVKEAPPAPPKASAAGIGEALFGVKPPSATISNANPFASSSSFGGGNPFASKSNPFAPKQATPEPAKEREQPKEQPKEQSPPVDDLPKTFAETLSLNNPQTQDPPPPPEPWPAEKDMPEPYPERWLADAEYETLDPTPLPVAQATSMEIDSGDAGGSGGGKEDKEVFESSMDATFQKFADRVGQNPDQCIRYEFGGQPLLYSKEDAVGKLLHGGDEGKVKTAKGLPRCANCGAGRVFEVQLTPHAIEELEIDEDSLDGMDWGTVVVGVCERDCQERGTKAGEASYIEEWAGVQWEELTVKR
ncbi:hypothetical protein OQA88_8452 [Cercophora sp. LCS_1]